MPTTRWSLILQAAREDEEASRKARAALCDRYWYPLYVFLRRLGADSEQAQDVVQSLFLDLLADNWPARVDPEIGQFRKYLRGAARNALRNLRREMHRRPDALPLEIEFEDGERRFLVEPSCATTPEKEFERMWARALLRSSLGELEREYRSRGEEILFRKLVPYLSRLKDDPPYETLALQLGRTHSALRTAASRLRLRFRNRIREHVSAYTEDQRVEAEIRFLFEAFAND